MADIFETLDSYLKEKDMGRAFSRAEGPHFKAGREEQILLLPLRNGENCFYLFLDTVKKLLGDEIQLVWVSNDFPQGSFRVAFEIPKIGAEKVCAYLELIPAKSVFVDDDGFVKNQRPKVCPADCTIKF